ncbi:hypothetical protein EHS25_002736 [Saitozyma podzolica]|uniref:Uncharacterized protein n=1 Tax=Saitozyma podzolica TaxID=1890683 RepID=A0A427YD66_9TREE|nr:hypothetical protein EHS25_002736 [Saitozyma podzolica]
MAKVQTFPSAWEGVLSGLVEENDASGFLTTLGELIGAHHVPSRPHFQLLLYLAINPPLETTTQTPLSLLSSILSSHSSTSLSALLPCVPSSSREPAWFAWQAHSELERRVRTYLRPCVDEGIWALLWDRQKVEKGEKGLNGLRNDAGRNGVGKGKGKARANAADSDDEEEEEIEEKVVSAKGWELLEWFLDLWEKDRQECAKSDESDGSGCAYSRMLLDQFRRRGALQIDDAAAPLAVVRSSYSEAGYAVTATSSDRRSAVARLLSLLINTAICPNPPFHPGSLLLSLLSLLRTLPLNSLRLLLPTLRDLPPTVLSHLLTHAIEDLGGIRPSKTTERRRDPWRDFGDDRPFPAPKQEYVWTTLLPMKGSDTARLDLFKMCLASEMLQRYRRGWDFEAKDVSKIEASLGEGQEAKGVAELVQLMPL